MRADARANRQDVLAAARRLIAVTGPDVSLRAVAKEAGVGIATLYRHFATREDLYLGVVDDIHARVSEAIARHDEHWETDPEAAWSATVEDIAGFRLGAIIYQVAPVVGTPRTLATAMMERRRRAVETFTPLLDRARAAGLLREDVPTDRFFIGIATMTRPMPDTLEDAMPGQSMWMVRAFLQGLRP